MKDYKIVHLADIHIHNDQRHDEYQTQFEKLYIELKEKQPDRIALVGDLFNDFITISNEAKQLAGNFLNELSKIAKVVIVNGNHDIRKKSLNRKTSVETIVKLISNDNVIYFDKSGFYEDEDIVWVNYSHLEKTILPWRDIKHKKDNNKVYISLFHDPIYGCALTNGMTMESKNLVKMSDFKNNDLNLFGDIHLQQFLDDKSAYCGSLIQQNFGEFVDSHGGILWTINKDKKIKHKEFDIPNEHTYHNFYLNEPDYMALDKNKSLVTSTPTTDMDIKVEWKDYSSNINLENELEIRNFLSKKYNIEPSKIKFNKTHIYQNILSSQKLNESLNINDKVVQQEIFKEYLKINKYEDDFIDKILEVDDIINGRLQIPERLSNIEWCIDKFWIDNFKSYDNAEITCNDINGLIQIGGINQQGKTTIFDAICYILFGTTLATNKLGGGQREKYGDNRYINNARDLDYCSGGAIINVSGDIYTIVRRTDRTWSKGKNSISSVTTNLEFYDGLEIIEENKLAGERKAQTQSKLDSILGDFDDFIRLALTNSENLNNLLSMDRATFIDSIIRDAGYDIFEKKLEEFKEYKKSFKDDRITLDLKVSEDEVNTLKTTLLSYKDDSQKQHDLLKGVEKKIDAVNSRRDEQLKKIHTIDEEIASINVDDINSKLAEYQNVINDNLSKQKTNLEKSKSLKNEYDTVVLENSLKNVKKLQDDILNAKLKISQSETNIEKYNSAVKSYEEQEKRLVENTILKERNNIKTIENSIKEIEKEIDDYLYEIKQSYKDLIKDSEYEIKTINTELQSIKESGRTAFDAMLHNVSPVPTL